MFCPWRMDMIRIHELRLPPDHTDHQLKQAIRRLLRLNSQSFSYIIRRRSIDARKKPEILYSYVIDVSVDNEKKIWKASRLKSAELVKEITYQFPQWNTGRCVQSGTLSSVEVERKDRPPFQPVIVGSGPAGMFCALMLARAGFCPIVLERGEPVEERTKTVEKFWKEGVLNPESNVQFGEGGAGTFSDGKLNTQIKDPDGRVQFVLKEFVKAGAKPEICIDQKPHIGTDCLRTVVQNIRREIEALGGTYFFRSCLTDIQKGDDGTICLKWNDQHETAGYRQKAAEIQMPEPEIHILKTRWLVLAIGHSSRDTLRMLYSSGMNMQAKAFAVGVRVQHPQEWINRVMYGDACPYEMEAAPYKVTRKTAGGRGVYSFCMCPGGYVVNASSEEGRLCVNGMSYSDRGGANANSAIVVTVDPKDYVKETEGTYTPAAEAGEDPVHPLSGLRFQEMLEERAFRAGNGKIPVQRLEDFRQNQTGAGAGSISPAFKGEYTWANVRGIFPESWSEAFLEGMDGFEKIIPGFSHPDVLLAGVESRTSSPVRILRDERCQSNIPGIFPCGEGAGYAGGIVSAAVDGIRVAEAVYLDSMGK